MEYTVNQLAALSGVTKRTLRYYDQQGPLPPKRISSAGYRIYGPAQVDRLQQILFLKQFGLKLEEIKEIMRKPGFDIPSFGKTAPGFDPTNDPNQRPAPAFGADIGLLQRSRKHE